MAGEAIQAEPNVLRRLTLPVAIIVVGVVAASWYVTWSTSDFAMSLAASPFPLLGLGYLALFFALTVVMMVAMMLPSAVPMIATYHGITKLEAGRPTKPGDAFGTAIFAAAYFIVWGVFGVVALLGLTAIGLTGSMMGPLVLIPAATLFAVGAFQATRAKEVCLGHCQSPMGFLMGHWRPGGALRMGLHHAVYCVGCCWLFMLVLFVVGSMNLVWMGALSLAISAEKVGPWQPLASRAIAILLLLLGILLAARLFLS